MPLPMQVVQTLLGTDSAAGNLGAVTVDRNAPVISLNGAATITLIYLYGASRVTDNLDASITLDISGETVDTQARHLHHYVHRNRCRR